ncbi:MAG TPA: AAA family ATPase [Candidatus Saccharibacteria bacterium]|nr:AAA family ATPase [Candidatus Saccharibacteria bacterium]HMR38633.1 AAA family ATPase [Candidatus Saccharibacteria bacterium]
MRISTIYIKNYRLLEDFELSPNDSSDFMLCIGRNNVGKTSILTLLDECLNNDMQKVSFDDITLARRRELVRLIIAYQKKEKTLDEAKDTLLSLASELAITIDYSDPSSDLSLIPVLSLDDKHQSVTISLRKPLDYQKLDELLEEFEAGKEQYGGKLENFLEKRWYSYASVLCCASSGEVILDYDSHDKSHGRYFGISDIIKLYSIKAKRGVANDADDKYERATLSKYVHTYLGSESDNSEQLKELYGLIAETDKNLTEKYNNSKDGIFKNVIDDIKEFIPGTEEQKLFVRSMIRNESLLGYGNTKIFYGDEDRRLPEGHSGLGYMNMYAIIIKLRTIIERIERTRGKVLANILFIEEPEAHTHPHMQYVFANKIKSFLNKQNVNNLLTIATTHSSHIISQFSDTDDIVFLRKLESKVKPIHVREAYSGKEHEAFLKQYLTVHRAELFFADKVIFIEGDTERILMPYFIKLHDKNKRTDLGSQYISTIDVGNYMYLFEDFIRLLGVPTLMITDIDTGKKNDSNRYVKCATAEAEATTNPTLKHYFPNDEISNIKSKDFDNKRFDLSGGTFTPSNDGNLQITYQTEQGSYLARSFEDSFMSINKNWLVTNKTLFKSSLSSKFDASSAVTYTADEDYIKSKAMFAIDIINADSKLGSGSSIQIPKYIEEGLEWLAKN